MRGVSIDSASRMTSEHFPRRAVRILSRAGHSNFNERRSRDVCAQGPRIFIVQGHDFAVQSDTDDHVSTLQAGKAVVHCGNKCVHPRTSHRYCQRKMDQNSAPLLI